MAKKQKSRPPYVTPQRKRIVQREKFKRDISRSIPANAKVLRWRLARYEKQWAKEDAAFAKWTRKKLQKQYPHKR